MYSINVTLVKAFELLDNGTIYMAYLDRLNGSKFNLGLKYYRQTENGLGLIEITDITPDNRAVIFHFRQQAKQWLNLPKNQDYVLITY